MWSSVFILASFLRSQLIKSQQLQRVRHFKNTAWRIMNENMCETKSGSLVLTPDANSNRHIRLKAFAYTRVCDPFIVFYSDSAGIWKKPCAFLRLKSCLITENSDVSFTLTPQGERIGNSTGKLRFSAESPKEKEEWIRVLRDFEHKDERNFKKINRRSRDSRKLPVIQESCSEEIGAVEQRRSSLIPVWITTFMNKIKTLNGKYWTDVTFQTENWEIIVRKANTNL